MRAHRLRRPLPHALSPWLLWLALLLPVAQSLAAWHAYGHVATAAAARADASEQKARLASHCDLCLLAAAAASGAPPGAAPVLPPSVAHRPVPVAAPAGVVVATPTAAYRSRAPPFITRSS